MACNALSDGTCLKHLEPRRTDETFLDPLALVNRPDNRASHERAATEVDRPSSVRFLAGFRSVLLGDTYFSQTEHLDRWGVDPRVRFVLAVDATLNSRDLAEQFPSAAWNLLHRPTRYELPTEPR